MESVPALAEITLKKHGFLISDAMALAKRGLLPGDKLPELKSPRGYRETAFHTLALCAILRAGIPQFAGKSAITQAENDEAEADADRLLRAVAEREQSANEVADTAKLRHRIFTLFVSDYDDTREGIRYLRRKEGDVDDFAPSLYSARSSAKRKAAPSEPAPVPGQNAATDEDFVSADAPVVRAPNNIPVGLPGSSPFIRG